MPIDQELARTAAEQANKLFGKWMPERWLNLFVDSYNDIEACRGAESAEAHTRKLDDTGKSADWFPYPVKESDA